MDLKSSFIQGMQAPIPVQQIPEDLAPYLQSLQALKQHESKYKQLDRVDKFSKRQAEKMRKEIEKSKYEYYEGEDKTSSFSPFRRALVIKTAKKTPEPTPKPTADKPDEYTQRTSRRLNVSPTVLKTRETSSDPGSGLYTRYTDYDSLDHDQLMSSPDNYKQENTLSYLPDVSEQAGYFKSYGSGSQFDRNVASKEEVIREQNQLARDLTEAATTFPRVGGLSKDYDKNLAYAREISPTPGLLDETDFTSDVYYDPIMAGYRGNQSLPFKDPSVLRPAPKKATKTAPTKTAPTKTAPNLSLRRTSPAITAGRFVEPALEQVQPNLPDKPVLDLSDVPSPVKVPSFAQVDKANLKPTREEYQLAQQAALKQDPRLQRALQRSGGSLSRRDRAELGILSNQGARRLAREREQNRVSDINKRLRPEYEEATRANKSRDAKLEAAKLDFDNKVKEREEAQKGFLANRDFNLGFKTRAQGAQAEKEYDDQLDRADAFTRDQEELARQDRESILKNYLGGENILSSLANLNNRLTSKQRARQEAVAKDTAQAKKEYDDQLDRADAFTRDQEELARQDRVNRETSLSNSLFNELSSTATPEEVQRSLEQGRYPAPIARMITNDVLPRLKQDRLQRIGRGLEQMRGDLFDDSDDVAEREAIRRGIDSDNLETAKRFNNTSPYLGGNFEDRSNIRYSRTPKVPEPSYSQYFSDRFQDLKDYGSELASDANRLGTRLLRPVTSRVQDLASDAIQNFDFVRNMVGDEAARKLNEELFYATGRGEYLDRMGLQQREPGTEDADRINKIRSSYRSGQGDYSLDSYIDRQLDKAMKAYDQDRPVPDRKDEAAFDQYNQDRENYKKDSLDNLRDFYGREGNQLGTGSIRTDNPYREALDFTQDVFSDPRKFLDRAAMGAKEKFDDFITDIPTSSNQVYNQLDVNNPLRQFFEPEGLRDPVNDVTALEQVMRTDPDVKEALTRIYGTAANNPEELSLLIGRGMSSDNPRLRSKALEAMTILEDQLVRQDANNTRYFDRDEQGNVVNREMTPEMEADFQQRDELLRNTLAQINSNTRYPGGLTMLDFASNMQNLNSELEGLDPNDPRAREAEKQLLSNIERLDPDQAEQMLQAMGIVNRTTGRISDYPPIDVDKIKDKQSLLRYLY